MSDIATYNAHDHLVTIQMKQGLKPYYPACWRLYELSIRFANANFKSEIVHMDVEKDLVIVKAYLFLGTDYASSEKKAEAFKQGKLSMLDKVETAAKARAARDFGISTELALDMEDATVDETTPSTPAPAPSTTLASEAKSATNGITLGKLKKRAIAVGWISDDTQLQLAKAWANRLLDVFGSPPEEDVLNAPQSLKLIHHHLEQWALESASAA